MWELALLIAAASFLLLVIFSIPVLLQLRDAAKELEFTLRESRAALAKVREVAEKADEIAERGREVVGHAGRALAVVDQAVGGAAGKGLLRGLAMALDVVPVVLAARRLFIKHRRKEGV